MCWMRNLHLCSRCVQTYRATDSAREIGVPVRRAAGQVVEIRKPGRENWSLAAGIFALVILTLSYSRSIEKLTFDWW